MRHFSHRGGGVLGRAWGLGKPRAHEKTLLLVLALRADSQFLSSGCSGSRLIITVSKLAATTAAGSAGIPTLAAAMPGTETGTLCQDCH